MAVEDIKRRQEVRESWREVRGGAARATRARPGSIAGRIVAVVRDLARQGEVESRVVDRPVRGPLNLAHAQRQRADQDDRGEHERAGYRRTPNRAAHARGG